ncbi:MAG TPA: ATP-binding protein [Stellaceae bacterium]|jgi:signal transduction histidine kinase|nr:ATP-binding protein [Stellaceae bacterium]
MAIEAVNERVLILAPAGRDAPLVQGILQRAGVDSLVCEQLDHVCDALEAGAAAVLIAEEALLESDSRRLLSWVRAQESWSDLPFVVLLERGGRGREKADIIFLNSSANMTLLERPISAATLVSTLQAALRARRRQYEVRNALDALSASENRYRLLAADLERLVEARTKSLAESNTRLTQEIVERERAEQALQQTQKLEAIGQLTSGVAHDFNNLLQAVLGNLEIARLRTDSDNVRRYLDTASLAAQRGAKLVAQLLAFARKQHLVPAAVDLNSIIASTRDLLARTIGALVEIKTESEPDLWPALVDPTQIELALVNLCLNGRDAMPGGGRLTLSTCNVLASERPHGAAPGDYVALAVADTGVGMSDDVLARAFDPFFTTKDIGKGSGLGLSMVHGLAVQSGGIVVIESRVGAGTTVRVYLPRAKASAAPVCAPEGALTTS